MPTIAVPPPLEDLPSDVYFRAEDFGPDTYMAPHAHVFGQLSFVSYGSMNIDVEGKRFLSPPHYAVWIPPLWKHSAYNETATAYCSVYISAQCSGRFSDRPCALELNPILRAILVDFAERDIHVPDTDRDRRLAEVLLDQIEIAPPHEAYLPHAASAEIQSILDALQADPASDLPLAAWAERFHMTVRTLERRCQRELGISLGEWRQRMRFLRAVEWLDKGRTIQAIAFDLGYSTPSAFIAMFKRLSGKTPEQYRVGR
ncbi:helix-turn-helix transcriptional regulator [Agrobacterium rhizogenes]|uniref:AraC family transcriptional regulator n=1 Tax=Rhizobium rhizogenes TaxID=359 RepID=UPI001573CE78|nr:helix-turn-helix transcriptional regulator [Rhizobium rhizogenes]NTG51007.1 helix-turn-helix transcriptional regulator [Rhizobium rhizogenes]